MCKPCALCARNVKVVRGEFRGRVSVFYGSKRKGGKTRGRREEGYGGEVFIVALDGSDLFMGLFERIIISGCGLGLRFWLECDGVMAIIFCVIWAFGCKGD